MALKEFKGRLINFDRVSYVTQGYNGNLAKSYEIVVVFDDNSVRFAYNTQEEAREDMRKLLLLAS